MRSTFTNSPTKGRLSSSSITLPTYMEATKPQKISGRSVTSEGPGGTPWIISAAISTAVIGAVGNPRASTGTAAPVTAPAGNPSAGIGTKAPVDAALFADSGPATPATAPLPNSSGCLEI